MVDQYASEITDNYEIVLVDDRSPDASWKETQRLAGDDPRIRGVRLSRNFGQQLAITAGLEASRGEYVIVMDADLQDHPQYIPDLYETVTKGYDLVYTLKRRREHTRFRNMLGVAYSRVLNLFVAPELRDDSGIGNYSILNRRVVDHFVAVKDKWADYLHVLRWMGFTSTTIEIDHHTRPSGRSAYSLPRLVDHAVNGLATQSDRPLKLAIIGGFSFVALSFLTAIVIVALWFAVDFQEGWPSLFVLILFCTGVILTFLGIAGIYIGKMFEQTRGRPLYIVEETLNLGEARDYPPLKLAKNENDESVEIPPRDSKGAPSGS